MEWQIWRKDWWSGNVVERIWFCFTAWETWPNGLLNKQESTHSQRALKLLMWRRFKEHVEDVLGRFGSTLSTQLFYKALGMSNSVKVAHGDLHVLNLSSGWLQGRGSQSQKADTVLSCVLISLYTFFLELSVTRSWLIRIALLFYEATKVSWC